MKPLKAWRIENWNPGDHVYASEKPANVHKTIFLTPCWFDARESARSFFGRDIPNDTVWIEVQPLIDFYKDAASIEVTKLRTVIAAGSLVVSLTLDGIAVQEVDPSLGCHLDWAIERVVAGEQISTHVAEAPADE